MSVAVSSAKLRLMRSLTNHFIRNESGCAFRGPEWGMRYRPEWKMRGSLWRSSANSKKARSGLTAFLGLDQRGKCLAERRVSLLIELSLLLPYSPKISYPMRAPAKPDTNPETGTEIPLRESTGRESLRVAYFEFFVQHNPGIQSKHCWWLSDARDCVFRHGSYACRSTPDSHRRCSREQSCQKRQAVPRSASRSAGTLIYMVKLIFNICCF